MKNFLIVGLCLSLIGCAANREVKPFVEPQYGMTKLHMLALLGKPDSIEIYKKTDLTIVDYYIYLRQPSGEKVPVCLINNRIVGWGETYYEDHVSSDDTRLK